jgi:hypothetical protein
MFSGKCAVLALVGMLVACAATPTPTASVPTRVKTSTPKPPSTTLTVPPPSTTPIPTATQSPIRFPSPTSPLTEAQVNELTQQMILAAEAGDTTTVMQLLQDGAALNGQDAAGRTAAMAATHGNRPETLLALIDAGADINLRDNRLDNPFLYAGAEGLLDILRLTIAAGADPTITNRFGGTALIPAAERGHVEVVAELLANTSVDVNHVNNLGWMALLEAIILSDGGPRHVEVVRLLIDAGADVNLPDANGVTPLAHAQARGYTVISEILLAVGAR